MKTGSGPSSRITLNSWLWPAVILLLVLLQILVPYRGWVILLVGFGSLFAVGYYWTRQLARHLSLTREVRYGWAQVGDLLEERFSLANTGWVPAVWVEIDDHSTIPGYSVSRATGVGGESTNSWQTHQVCSQRGIFQLGPTSYRTGDPFGIFTVSFNNPACADLMVTPQVVPLPSIEVAPGGRAGEGRPAPRSLERTTMASSVRQHAPGDALRWIHWPTTARKGSLFVKTFSNIPSGDWWILLDLDRAVQSGEGLNSSEETAVVLAASLASQGFQEGVPVGLIVGGQDLVWLPPRLGEGQRWQIFQKLAEARPGDLPLEALLAHLSASIRQPSSLVVISANLRPGWLDRLVALAWHGIVPTVLLLDHPGCADQPGPSSLLSALAEHGIVHYMVSPASLNLQEQADQVRYRWEWRLLPTGKAVSVHRPPEMSWKVLD